MQRSFERWKERFGVRYQVVGLVLSFFVAVAPGVWCPANAASVLDTVRARGKLICGVSEHSPGFSEVNAAGAWRGIDIEFCSALAAAVLGDKGAVKFLGLTPADRFKSLEKSEVDVLLGGTAWTMSRDTDFDARFVGVLYYDGQGFLAPRNHSISSVLELSGASICVLNGSSDESAIADYFGSRKMRYQLVKGDRWEDLIKAYLAGGCTVLTGDTSLLAYERGRMVNGSEQTLLPEFITKEPLGPAVRSNDDGWFDIVRWTLMALIDGEELGINSGNVDVMKASEIHEVRRFLGIEADLGAPLGLPRDWAYQIIRQVGNYAEIFQRTLGEDSRSKLDRGLNALWSKGGLMYAVPLR